MKIYIVDLATYNAGAAVGAWLSVDDGLPDAIAEFLASTGGEEWAAHDYDGAPAGTADAFGEHPDLDALCLFADDYADHGAAFAAWWRNTTSTEYSIDEFREAYAGPYDSGADYAQSLAEESGADLSGWPHTCIDWNRAWRELTHAGYWIESGHVFAPI